MPAEVKFELGLWALCVGFRSGMSCRGWAGPALTLSGPLEALRAAGAAGALRDSGDSGDSASLDEVRLVLDCGVLRCLPPAPADFRPTDFAPADFVPGDPSPAGPATADPFTPFLPRAALVVAAESAAEVDVVAALVAAFGSAVALAADGRPVDLAELKVMSPAALLQSGLPVRPTPHRLRNFHRFVATNSALCPGERQTNPGTGAGHARSSYSSGYGFPS